MKPKIVIGLLGIAATLTWTGLAKTHKMSPPNGETVWNLEGLWGAVVENYGELERSDTSPNMYLIKQAGN